MNQSISEMASELRKEGTMLLKAADMLEGVTARKTRRIVRMAVRRKPRVISAAGRRRIAASQKARWARFHAQQKKKAA